MNPAHGSLFRPRITSKRGFRESSRTVEREPPLLMRHQPDPPPFAAQPRLCAATDGYDLTHVNFSYTKTRSRRKGNMQYQESNR